MPDKKQGCRHDPDQVRNSFRLTAEHLQPTFWSRHRLSHLWHVDAGLIDAARRRLRQIINRLDRIILV
jgi:hypothetical protein